MLSPEILPIPETGKDSIVSIHLFHNVFAVQKPIPFQFTHEESVRFKEILSSIDPKKALAIILMTGAVGGGLGALVHTLKHARRQEESPINEMVHLTKEEAESFARFFVHYYPNVMRFTRHNMGSNHSLQDEEDIIATVFTNCLAKWHRYSELKAPVQEATLIKSAHNTVKNWRRHKARHSDIVFEDYMQEEESEWIPEDPQSPEDTAIDNLELEKLEADISRFLNLKSGIRRQVLAFELHRSGLENIDVARILNTTPGAVKALCVRFYENLKNFLKITP